VIVCPFPSFGAERITRFGHCFPLQHLAIALACLAEIGGHRVWTAKGLGGKQESVSSFNDTGSRFPAIAFS
jgi:hypothetical protein